MFSVRLILWTVDMAYTGFLLTGQGLRTFNSLSITEAFLGALTEPGQPKDGFWAQWGFFAKLNRPAPKRPRKEDVFRRVRTLSPASELRPIGTTQLRLDAPRTTSGYLGASCIRASLICAIPLHSSLPHTCL
jgi:hypothetical protein